MSSLLTLIHKFTLRKMSPPVIGFIDNESISRSLSRYLFVTKHVRGLVLDIGCGSCYGISIIKRIGGDKVYTIGLDIDVDLLSYGRLIYDVDDLIVASAEFLPFRKRSFDSVICLELIEHLSKKGQIKLCQGINAILKRNGFSIYLNSK